MGELRVQRQGTKVREEGTAARNNGVWFLNKPLVCALIPTCSPISTFPCRQESLPRNALRVPWHLVTEAIASCQVSYLFCLFRPLIVRLGRLVSHSHQGLEPPIMYRQTDMVYDVAWNDLAVFWYGFWCCLELY